MLSAFYKHLPASLSVYQHPSSSFQPLLLGWGTKVCVHNWLEPSGGILHRYHLTRGSTLTSQDYSPSSVVYVPEPIRVHLAVFSIDRNAIGCCDFSKFSVQTCPFWPRMLWLWISNLNSEIWKAWLGLLSYHTGTVYINSKLLAPDFWFMGFRPVYVHTVFPRIVSAETILFWI